MTVHDRRQGPASRAVAEALERITALNPALNAFITVIYDEALQVWVLVGAVIVFAAAWLNLKSARSARV